MPFYLSEPPILIGRTLEEGQSESLRQFLTEGHLFELVGLSAALVVVLMFLGSSQLERASLPRRWRYGGLFCALVVLGLGVVLGQYIKPMVTYDIVQFFERRPSLLLETRGFTNRAWVDVA